MRFLHLFLLIFIISCASEIQQNELTRLNGYWEITQVTFTNGETKTFTTSTTVDYIELNNFEGFRKKVQPKLDGTFETSNDAKRFTLVNIENGFDIQYHEEYAKNNIIVEQLTELSENSFSVKDQEGNTYTYARFEPIIIEE